MDNDTAKTCESTPDGFLLSRTLVVVLLATLCCALWGSAIPCIKIGYELLTVDTGSVPSILVFTGLRFTIAGFIVLAAYTAIERRLPRVPRASWGMVARLSLAQTVVQYMFFYVGVSNAPGLTGTIVNASNSFICILVTTLVFHLEPLTGRKVIGCLVGFAGVVIINLTGGSLAGSVSLTGEGFILISCVCYGVSSSLIRMYSQRENPVLLSGFQFFFGGITLIAAGTLLGGRIGPVTPAGAGMVVWLGIVSGVAYTVWSILLKHNPTSRVTIFGFMNPVFGVILSALLLHEQTAITPVQCLLALVLVAAGIMITSTDGASRSTQKLAARSLAPRPRV